MLWKGIKQTVWQDFIAFYIRGQYDGGQRDGPVKTDYCDGMRWNVEWDLDFCYYSANCAYCA